MNQYLVTGYDYTDEGAFERRLGVRPLHLEGVKALKDKGNYLLGGSIMNEEGKMIGSTMILQFENREQLDAWQQAEPYIVEKIWELVEIKPFKVAVV